ncbi:MAG: DegT/DnrJ/EryC1/StrS aminotransferase family protein [Deltaproteobacteria bacterium]|nr:DegT/DnrJ/EryC1/StrS aminotransferase family protein [Deltaproteobacteria bacterium]
MSKIPFLRPNPAKLSLAIEELRRIESTGIFSNFGPINTRLEHELKRVIFGGTGECVTVCNATTGLMIAMKRHLSGRPGHPRFALMPSFTFAATAHAALWAGLIPLLCDIDMETWTASVPAERELLDRFRDEIAVLVPCTTFGNSIDLAYYERLSEEYGIPVVVDAAAALGTLCEDGRAFGTGRRSAIVFSMHATKVFATAEAGVIYCADPELAAELRSMTNFGFHGSRAALMPGLNGKLSEVIALMALLKLRDFEAAVEHRAAIAELYKRELSELTFQRLVGRRQAFTFVSALLPRDAAAGRTELLVQLSREGIDLRTYFSPHLAEHPYFREVSTWGDLPNTEEVARRIISLPLSDYMTTADIESVAQALRRALNRLAA